jgi:hypothetical protein
MIVEYGAALRVLQEAPDGVMQKVRRLVEDGTTPELSGARRQLVNQAVTWAIKAYYNEGERRH